MTSSLPGCRGFSLLVVVLMGCAVATCDLARAAESGPRKVTIKAGIAAGDAKTAETYLNANSTYLRETLPGIVRKCAAAAFDELVVTFDLTLSVGQGGKITGTTSDPTNAFTSCVSSAASEATFTAPPQVPTAVYLEVLIAR